MKYQKDPTSRKATLGAGIKLSLMTALFSGVAVFLNGLVVKSVGDPLVFTTIKNLGVALVVGAILATKMKKGEVSLKQLESKDWLRLGMIGVIGGSMAFYLFFKGLLMASSAQAALIHKSLVLWVAVWALPVLKEKMSLKQWGLLGMIFGSNFLIGGLGQWQWGRGETMMLAATVLWAVENVIAKMVLKKVKVEVVAGARMILGSLLLLLAVVLSGKLGLVAGLSAGQWGLTLLTIGLLTGYVLSWYKALKAAPVTLVATVLSLGSIVSNLLSSLFITHKFEIGLFYQSILLVIFSWFFVKEVAKHGRNITVRPVRI